jgi:hypothetical protein
MAMNGKMSATCGNATFLIANDKPDSTPSAAPSAAPSSSPPSTNCSPPRSGDQLNSAFNMTMHQEMEHTSSSISWSLYNMTTCERIYGPSGGNLLNKDTGGVPYDIQIWVQNPTDKDTTDIQFATNAGRPNNEFKAAWNTGTAANGYSDMIRKGQDYACFQDRTIWKAKGQGFERDFICWFLAQPPSPDGN